LKFVKKNILLAELILREIILCGSGEICGGNWETAVGTAPSFWKSAKSFPPEM